MHSNTAELEKKEILKRYRKLLSGLNPKNGRKEKLKIRKAFNFAVDAHKDMRRLSGEPYIYHPLEVATIVSSQIGLGATSVICALLHDVVEDTDTTIADIEGLFGEKVAKIIDGLTKIKGIFDHKTSSIQAENFRKIIITLSDDVRVILIKLADRLHNMQTLDAMRPDKQMKIASETLYIYAPLAHRLGLYNIKTEMEDLAMKYTDSIVYQTIAQKLKDTEKDRNKLINKFTYPIKKALVDEGIKFTIVARTKSIHSIWNKMKKKEIPFEEVFDLFAVRIILDTSPEKEKTDCWKVYAIITGIYRPKTDRLRDWISMPKANGYESLHTTLMSRTGKWVEVQIRSTRMDEIAEKGYAAHWKYKEIADPEVGLEQWLTKIRESFKNEESNAIDFITDFKLNLFSEEIYVFTPKGDLKTLPFGATALDFAYNIHSQIGNNCIGAKVNNKLVPLNHKLKTGDQVEIITSGKQKPKSEWSQFVVTARAKSQIKDAIKDDKKKLFEKGKEKLGKLFYQQKIDFNPENISKFQTFTKLGLTDLYYRIAKGIIGVKEVKACFTEQEKSKWFDYINPFTKTKPQQSKSLNDDLLEKLKKNKAITIKAGSSEIQYNVSSCCNPIPGDSIIGLLAPDKPIEVHRTNCPKAIPLMSKYGSRIIKTRWTNPESQSFITGIKVTGIDRVGLINQITNILATNFKSDIRNFHFDSNGEVMIAAIMIMVTDTKNLNDIMDTIKSLDDIKKVYRINNISDALL
jgi:guanosine-3',5'-bis(diphosphate) 3'-pyrophosphohydrolase